MSITHCVIASAVVSLILATADPLTLGLGIIGSQLPDLDTSTSFIGQIFFPLSSFIEDRFPHRSITHSLLATVFICAITLPIGYYLGDIKTASALPLGHLIACFSDTFTKQGVQLFYPDPAWAVAGTNPRRRIKTGSVQEYWVLAGFTGLLVFALWVADGGGLTEKVSQSLGLKTSVIKIYNEKAGTNHIYAVVEGVWSSDRSKADGEYFILDTAERGEFLLTDGESIYQTNRHLLASKLTAKVGEKAMTLNQSLTFEDAEAISALKQLQQAYSNAEIYLSGTITVDFPEDITPDFPSNKIATLTKMEEQITLSYHPIGEAITDLQDQFVIGTINAKIVNPKPSFPK